MVKRKGYSLSSKLEDTLLGQIKLLGLPVPIRECKFHPTRRWRSDFLWPSHDLIVEVEGGVFTGGRHTRPLGFINDCEKYNEAVLAGYKILRVTSQHIKTGEALNWIERALKQDL